MPFHHQLIDNGRLLQVTAEGIIVTEQILDITRAIMALPGFKTIEGMVWRFDEAESIHTDAEQLRHLVGAIGREPNLRPDLKLAMVAADPLAFGFSRVFQTYSTGSPWRTEIFRDEAAAIEWLADPE